LEDLGIDRTILKCTLKKQDRGRRLDWSGSCRDKCWTLWTLLGNFGFKMHEILTSRGTVSFSKRTLFHIVNYFCVLAPCTIVGSFSTSENWATCTCMITECGESTFRCWIKLTTLHGVRNHRTNIWGTGN
jgi:hypothetical protein